MKHLFSIHYLLFTLLLTLVLSINANAQSTIDNILIDIAKNNKTIIANTQYWEAQKLQYRTGLTPYNPSIEYDFLSGSPASAGDQHDFSITQSFDFPTAYIKKSQLAKQQTTQIEFQLLANRQEILLQAKKICIELIYHNKLQIELENRKKNTEKLLSDFKSRLEKGEGTILDVNKAQLQLIEIKKEYQENISKISQLNEKLTELNGGNKITFMDTSYFVLPHIPSFEQLESDYESNDPLRKILEQEKTISQKQIELSKSLVLPKMELGYHYQGILGQTYNGIHTGITIPLWENKNVIKSQQSKTLLAELELEEHKNEHYYEIKRLYTQYENLKITLIEYQTAFSSLNSVSLLNKALALGQISSIEYFMEISYYNTAFTNYLQTEKEYYLAVAELYKYKL